MGGCPALHEGATGFRRLLSPACLRVGRGARARLPLAVGAGMSGWVCRPSVGRAVGCGCAWCAWCAWCLCVCVGAWWPRVCHGAVVRGAASVRPSLLCSPLIPSPSCCCVCRRAVARGCAPFPACAPCSCASPALLVRYPPSSFLVAAFFYPFLYPLLVGPPLWCVFFPASLASVCVARLFPLPTSLFSRSSLLCVATACLLFPGPLRHGMDRGVGCCGGGGYDDACNYGDATAHGHVYALAVAVSPWPT